jgi:HNH endonuclease
MQQGCLMPIPERRMRAHIYPNVGRCIYCGSDGEGEGLRTEHIIPGGLGGRLELPEASCVNCEKETSAFEGRVLGKIYGTTRAHFGVRREQTGKRRWPDNLPVPVSDDSGVSWKTVEVPISEHPDLFFAIKLQPPRLFSGVPLDDTGFHNVLVDGMGDRDMWERAAKIATNKRIGLNRGGVHVDQFGRFLAKIGHSYAVAEIGINGFKPFLINAILNKRPMYLGHYIGGASAPGSQQPDVHELSRRKQQIGDRDIWIVRVHLFADIGVVRHGSPIPTSMPAYDVAVGAATRN